MSLGPRRRRLALALGGLTLLALVLRVAFLSDQPLIDDDVMVATTARAFAVHGWPDPTMWNHPRLRDLLVSASLDLAGEGPWGVKPWSVLTGTLAVPALGLLVLALGGGTAAALVAALLLALDGLHLDFSRQGINDVYLSFFPVAALAAVWRWRARRAPGWLALAGALFGLGLASKWSVALPLALAGAVALRDAFTMRDEGRGRAARAGLVVAALGLLPLAVYLVTWLPWFGRGHTFGEWLAFHRAMAYETATHTGYAGTKLPGYRGEIVAAWRWFVAPVYYLDDWHVDRAQGVDFGWLAGIGNPAVWLLVWPAAAFAAWRALRRADGVARWLLAFFAAVYLPFALSTRPIWTNSAVAALPFAVALVAYAAAHALAWRPWLARAWLAAAVVAGAALWFPAAGLHEALPVAHLLVPDEAFQARLDEAAQRAGGQHGGPGAAAGEGSAPRGPGGPPGAEGHAPAGSPPPPSR